MTWLCLLLCCMWLANPVVGQAGAGQPATAATSRPGQEYSGLEFVTLNAGGVTLHVQAPLAGHKDEFAKTLEAYLKDEEAFYADVAKMADRTDQVLEDIHRLVGLKPSDETAARHRKSFQFFLSALRLAHPGRSVAVYILGRQSVKEHLRKGNVLPHFSYDRDKDEVSFHAQWGRASSSPELDAALTLPLPLDETQAVEQFQAFVQGIRKALDENVIAVAMHEVIEASIVHERLKPADPWFRWFSDGFANALTFHLLRNYCGDEKAEGFAQGFDPGKLNFAREEVNLRYWPGLAHMAVNHPAESELSQARYSYATEEARRVIEAHGVEVVARILDKACTTQPASSEWLIAAMSEVTGQDVSGRLARYQTYESVAGGLNKYGPRYVQASKDGNSLEAMKAHLRLHELVSDSPVEYSRIMWAISAQGLPAAADGTFKARAQMAVDYNTEDNQIVWLSAFLAYAMEVGRAEIAFDQAEQLLALQPDNVIAMVVRLKRLQKEGKLDEAEELARKVIALSPDEQFPPRREAARILREVLHVKREALREKQQQRQELQRPATGAGPAGS